MKKDVPISEIMTTKLITLTQDQSLYEANKLFHRYNIRHLPIVEEEKLVGILSQNDLLRISFADLDKNDENIVPIIYEMYSIPQLMTKVPVFIEVDSTVKEAAQILSRQSFHSLPVLDKGKLVGMVTTTDIINYLLDQY